MLPLQQGSFHSCQIPSSAILKPSEVCSQPTPNTHFLTGRKHHVQNEYKETKTLKPQEPWYHLQAGNKGYPKMHSNLPQTKPTATGGYK